MAGKADRLVADAFHEIAIRRDDEGVVIDQAVAKARRRDALGHRHAHRRRNALAQRTGRRLDTSTMAVFRMAGARAAQLAEALDVIKRDVLVTRQVQHRIQQHRAMTSRQHEAVAVRPARIARIEFQEACEQHRSDVSHAHRHAGMAASGRLNGINREGTYGVRHILVGNVRLRGSGHECPVILGRHRMKIASSAPGTRSLT